MSDDLPSAPIVFEELDRRSTPMGEISLRRRLEPSLQVDVWEVRLDDDFLMSSLFTAGEVALSRLGLAEVNGDGLDVVIGGLGLGFTAKAALAEERVASVQVIEALDAVIDWHRGGLFPFAHPLIEDPRCRFWQGDFFSLLEHDRPLGDARGACHAVLVDIDHTPSHHLHPSHAWFYTAAGLAKVAGRLHPGGVFALWSDAPPDDAFMANMHRVFDSAAAHVVAFPNFYTGSDSTNTVYVGRHRP